MIQPNPDRRRFPARPLCVLLILGTALGSAAWLASATAARPGGQDEKEEKVDPKKPTRKPPKLDEDPTDTKSRSRKTKLAAEAEQAKHPAARALFLELAVPFDRVVFLSKQTTRVEPVPDYAVPGTKMSSKRWTFHPLPSEEKPREFLATGDTIAGIEPYERIALDLVSDFLRRTAEGTGSSPQERAFERLARLQDAELALAVVINFHDSRREQKLRDESEGWKVVEKALREKLQTVQLDQMKALAEARDWNQAFALAVRLSEAYPHQKNVQLELGRLLARHAEQSLQDQDFRSAMQRIQLLEAHFPSNTETEPIRRQLEKRAEALLKEAEALEKEGRRADAQAKLRSAELTYPRLPRLQDVQLRLGQKYQPLYVGVSELPEFLSPATAVNDAEKQALELLFEGLLKLTFTRTGGPRHEPSLAEELPQLVPLGRAFQLSRKAYWSDHRRVTASDVSHTVGLLKDRSWPGHTPEWADLVQEARVEGDAFHINLTLSRGFMDPLALLSFKVLPDSLKRADDPAFARKPVGSGPYEFRGQDGKDGKYVVFRANPHYSDRDGKRLGLPQIREIRFFRSTNPVADFKTGSLHLLLDVPSRDVKPLSSSELAGTVRIHTVPARRVYFLAVNHRRTALKNKDLRRGLAHAINREQILTDCFRESHADWHRPLNGPYPPRSWACNPNLPADPFKEVAAKSRFDEAAKAVAMPVNLTLKYPEGDVAARAACVLIAKQVQEVDKRVMLSLEPQKLRDLHRDVVGTHDYDLAYFHHDFPDESYWLWPLFDPRSDVAGGQNFLGYRDDSVLASLFSEAMNRRAPEKVQELTHRIHDHLYEVMPLIPLWQLDRHLALHESLEAFIADPLQVFGDVENWVLKNR